MPENEPVRRAYEKEGKDIPGIHVRLNGFGLDSGLGRIDKINGAHICMILPDGRSEVFFFPLADLKSLNEAIRNTVVKFPDLLYE